jgi:Ni,Fe-hydrogenase III small subunit
MRILDSSSNNNLRGNRGNFHRAGRTLTETMIATALLGVVATAIAVCNIAGLKFTEFVRPKLDNARYGRQTISRIVEQVRCANSLQVGTGTATTFSNAPVNRPQSGNALKVFPTTNTSQYIYFYLDTNSQAVVQVDLGSSNGVAIATCVTNTTIFAMENFGGTTLTNPANNAVLSVQLQMRRDSNVKGVGDAFQVRSRITRRNIL